MNCSGRQPSEGEEELWAVIAGFYPGGVRSEGVGAFFKALTHAVLLFGAKTWVLTPMMVPALSSFQHRFV